MIEALLTLKVRGAGFTSRYVESLGTRIHYFEKQGDPSLASLVLVHGIGSRASHFHDMLPILAKSRHPLIIVDLPGHGESAELPGTANVQSFYETFAATIDQIAPPKFVLFGNSLGGAMAMLYGMHHPERLLGLILASPGAGFATQEDWDEFAKILEVSSIKDAEAFLERLFHRKPFYFSLLPRLFLDAISRKSVSQLIESIQFNDLLPPPGKLPYQGKTLLIWGKSEKLFPYKNLGQLPPLMAPEARIIEPDRIGHCPHFDNPHWLAKSLTDFATAT